MSAKRSTALDSGRGRNLRFHTLLGLVSVLGFDDELDSGEAGVGRGHKDDEVDEAGEPDECDETEEMGGVTGRAGSAATFGPESGVVD